MNSMKKIMTSWCSNKKQFDFECLIIPFGSLWPLLSRKL